MRTKLALLIAVVLGLLAAIGVRHYIVQKSLQLEGTARRVAIAVAREGINRGDILREHMIKPVEVEEIAVGSMHILYDQRKPWVGLPVAKQVKADEPLMKTDFLGATEVERTSSSRIEPGWRAVTVAADQVSGVAGLITPGCHVDILGTFRIQGRGPETAATAVTKLVARNVEVLAVDNRTDLAMPVRGGRPAGLDRGYSSVTVHVTALEASLLTFAQTAAKLSFTLRRTDDVQMKDIPAITQNELDEIIAAAARQREQLLQAPKGPGPTPP